jgi:hypothetical protein
MSLCLLGQLVRRCCLLEFHLLSSVVLCIYSWLILTSQIGSTKPQYWDGICSIRGALLTRNRCMVLSPSGPSPPLPSAITLQRPWIGKKIETVSSFQRYHPFCCSRRSRSYPHSTTIAVAPSPVTILTPSPIPRFWTHHHQSNRKQKKYLQQTLATHLQKQTIGSVVSMY